MGRVPTAKRHRNRPAILCGSAAYCGAVLTARKPGDGREGHSAPNQRTFASWHGYCFRTRAGVPRRGRSGFIQL